ncbi:MAG TPA: hypothetical protein VGD21_11635 [Lysobacter sp.]
MAASTAEKFRFKHRDELDTLIDEFERDLSFNLNELQAHYATRADIILSMTGADDDQYVCDRLNTTLRSHGLLDEASTAS